MNAPNSIPPDAPGWIQITVTVHRDAVDAASEAMAATGASATTIEDGGDQAVFDTGAEPAVLWDRVRVSGLYPAETASEPVLAEIVRCCGLAAPPPHHVTPVPERDWERAWMERFRPMRFGDRLWVVPSWHQAPDPHAINIVIDPGLAFGTGTHATTALCLHWLAAHPPRALDVIDYGCGSGILAVAAARLGAARTRAVDIDARAIAVAEENAARNGVADAVHCGPPSLADSGGADLVIANILARPLIELAPRIAAAVRPAGTLLLTGITQAQRDEVAAAYTPAFDFEPFSSGEWLLLAGTR